LVDDAGVVQRLRWGHVIRGFWRRVGDVISAVGSVVAVNESVFKIFAARESGGHEQKSEQFHSRVIQQIWARGSSFFALGAQLVDSIYGRGREPTKRRGSLECCMVSSGSYRELFHADLVALG